MVINGATMCPFMDRVQRLGGPWGPSRPAGACHDATSSSAADVLADHVLFEIEAIDRG